MGRHAAGNPLTYIVNVARRIVDDDGMVGLHCVRSNRMYIRWFAAAALATAVVVAVPKFVAAGASRTPTSGTAVVELGVAVIVQLRYGVICCDPTLRL